MPMNAQAQNMFIPRDPQDSPAMIFNKGMLKHLPSNRLPEGGVLDANGFMITQAGPKRRPGWETYISATGQNKPLQGIGSFWKADGTQVTVTWDTKFLYTIGATAFTRILSAYCTGTMYVSGSTVVGTSTAWNTAAIDIKVGDFISLDTDATEELEILTIDSDTQLTLVSTPTSSYATGSGYSILRALGANDPHKVDYAMVGNQMVLTDYNRTPRTYDGSTLGAYGTTGHVAGCVTFWKDRVWLGSLIETTDGTIRQRVRWSTPTSLDVFGALDYIDLTYSQGALLRLVNLGSRLMAYFEDAIWIGYPTQMGTPPIVFEQIDTGGIGLISMNAVQPWIGGHFFVGNDNIYFLSNRGIEPIGDAVVKETIKASTNLDKTYSAIDTTNERICFGFAGAGENVEKIWSYNYRTKGWSYEELDDCSMIAFRGIADNITWDNIMDAPSDDGTLTATAAGSTIFLTNGDLSAGTAVSDAVVFIDNGISSEERTLDGTFSVTGVTITAGLQTALTFTHTSASYNIVQATQGWDDLAYTSWDAIRALRLRGSLHYGTELGAMLKLSETATTDPSGNINALLESADYDFGLPNKTTTSLRMSIKIDEFLAQDLVFTVAGSANRGRTWKALGTLTISAGYDENYLNFRLTGSTHRFKLSSSSDCSPYTIIEIVLRVRGRGPELHLAPTV